MLIEQSSSCKVGGKLQADPDGGADFTDNPVFEEVVGRASASRRGCRAGLQLGGGPQVGRRRIDRRVGECTGLISASDLSTHA